MEIRHADPHRDAAACAAIYAPFVRESAVSFEETPSGPAKFAHHIEQIARHYAFLVADQDGEVAGYAYGVRHRERAAYRWAVETSVYVHADHRGHGVGTALYAALLPRLTRQGLWVALAGITLPNPASVALHERCGFEPIGVYRRIGWKAGAWRDVGWWQARLRDGDGPPSDPGPPPRLDDSRD